MELYLMRHGETVWNASGKLQGHSDIELNDLGKEQAKTAGNYLKSFHFDRVFASPLSRAYETAKLATLERTFTIETDLRLREMSLGILEGLTMDEVPQDFHAFFQTPHLYKKPEKGENYKEVQDRAVEFYQEKILPLSTECERILLVSHGAWIKTLLTYLKNLPLSEIWTGSFIKNCSISIVETDGSSSRVIEEGKTFEPFI